MDAGSVTHLETHAKTSPCNARDEGFWVPERESSHTEEGLQSLIHLSMIFEVQSFIHATRELPEPSVWVGHPVVRHHSAHMLCLGNDGIVTIAASLMDRRYHWYLLSRTLCVQHLACAKRHFESFSWISCFALNNSLKETLLSPICRWGHWGTGNKPGFQSRQSDSTVQNV